MIRVVLVLLFLLGFAVSAGGDPMAPPSPAPPPTRPQRAPVPLKVLPFTNVARAYDGALPEGEAGLITEPAAWSRFWDLLHANKLPLPRLPRIWFGEEVVAYCVGGRKPTTGFQVEIKNVWADHEGILIYCHEYSPHPTQFVGEESTQPYHLVRILIPPSVKRFLPVEAPVGIPWKVQFFREEHALRQLDHRTGRPVEVVGIWKGHWVKGNLSQPENPMAADEGDDPRQ